MPLGPAVRPQSGRRSAHVDAELLPDRPRTFPVPTASTTFGVIPNRFRMHVEAAFEQLREKFDVLIVHARCPGTTADCGDRVSIGRTRHDARACGSGETVGGRSYLLDRPYSKVAIIGTWSLYLRQSREDRARQLRKRPRERPRQTHSRSGSESCHVQSGSRCEDSPHRDRTCSPLIDPKHERDGASAHCDRLIPPVTFDGVHRVSHES